MLGREKNQEKNSSDSSATPLRTGMFRSRPFSDPTVSDEVSPHKQELPDLQTQLERGARFSQSLSRMKVYGNRPAIQPKISVGAPGDKYEQEADQMAQQVMSMPAAISHPPIQRLEMSEEEKEQVHTKPLAASITPLVQRETAPAELEEEQEQVQMKRSLQRAAENGSNDASSNLESQLNSSKGGGSPLPDEVRSFMEPRIGADFGSVRVHTDSEAVQMNRELNAQAFTHGNDIYFGAGKYNAESNDGKRLLAHELTHVVQQTGGVQRQNDVIQAQDDHSGSIIDQLRKALDGWGSDSSRVLQLLRQASPSERQEILADSALMEKLWSKLGRSEMLQALDALQAPLKDKLNAAMNGWGCDAEAIKALTKGASDTEKQAVLNDTALVSRLSSELSRAGMLAVLGNLNAPLKDKLNTAMNGWGCDVEAIKTLTKGASDTDKQAVLNDAALVSRLSSELSRADMLTVLSNLNAPLKDKLNAALNGWGCDAEAIKTLTKGASDTEKQAVLNDAALVSRLSSELSRADMLTVLGNLNAPLKDKLNAAMNGWGTDEAAMRNLILNADATQKQTVLSDVVFLRRMLSELSWNDFAKSVELLGRQAPDYSTLISDPIVQAALATAWANSNAAVPGPRTTQHEEGGWIYFNLVTGNIQIVPQTSGGQAAIDLSNPSIVAESVVVGKFHTHPNLGPQWVHGPSPQDQSVDAQHGVPDIVVAMPSPPTVTYYQSGPARRLHLAGERGLPGASGGLAPQAKKDGSHDEQ